MNRNRRRWLAALAVSIAIAAGGSVYWHRQPPATYLTGDTAAFVALFAPPPARDSATTRRELDELLEIQRTRTDTQVAAARADRKTDIARFFPALGLRDPQTSLPRVRRLAQHVEDDIRPFVRAAKDHFRRLRPYEIEPRLAPCIDRVAADLSYPSGHATFGFVMTGLLADLAPERRAELEARGEEFARQRMVCGVHFPSDIDAGRLGARWLMQQLRASPAYRADVAAAAAELRAAMRAAQGSGHSSTSRAPPRVALAPAVTRPRCNAAMRATMASPSPKPPVSRLRLVSSRVKALNTDARCASGIPSPSSSTTRRYDPPSWATSMLTLLRA